MCGDMARWEMPQVEENTGLIYEEDKSKVIAYSLPSLLCLKAAELMSGLSHKSATGPQQHDKQDREITSHSCCSNHRPSNQW